MSEFPPEGPSLERGGHTKSGEREREREREGRGEMKRVRDGKREKMEREGPPPTLLIPSSVMKRQTSSAEAYDALILVIGSV